MNSVNESALEVDHPKAPPIPTERTASRRIRLKYRRLSPVRLPLAERHAFAVEMAEVIFDALGPSSDSEELWIQSLIEARQQSFNAECDFLTVREGGRLVGVVGFRMHDLCGRKCLEMFGGYFRSEYQGAGIGFAATMRLVYSTLLRYPLAEHCTLIEVINPVVVAGWRRRLPVLEMMYPGIGGSTPAPELFEVAQEFMDRRRGTAAFDLRSGVIHGAHPGRPSLTSSCRDEEVGRYFEMHVNDGAGDSLLMILDGSRRSLLRALGVFLRSAPRSVVSWYSVKRRGRDLGHGRRAES